MGLDPSRARIQVRTMGHFVGERQPKRHGPKQCPDCGGPMSHTASICVACSGAKIAEAQRKASYSAEMMDRHRRWTAMLELGFTNRELIGMRPNLPTWEQIAVIKDTLERNTL